MPLILTVVSGLFLIAAHRILTDCAAKRDKRFLRCAERWIRSLGLTAAATAAVGLIVTPFGNRLGWILPAALVLTAAAIAYARWLKHFELVDPANASTKDWSVDIEAFCLLILAAIGALWLTSTNAAASGERDAAIIASNPVSRPEIVVYSKHHLAIAGRGVTLKNLKATDGDFKYQYTGLRLLIQRKDVYILLPSQWTRGADPVFRLTADSEIRIDVKARVQSFGH
jgi:hypothetical protein